MNITAQNTFTTPVLIQGGNTFDVSVSGTFVATVTLQRSKDGTTNWVDVDTLTEPGEWTGDAGSAWFYRLGVKTGEFTSGTVVVDLFD
ncbi:hypothetical protein Lo5R7ANS_61 [Mesorhizobium phage vB_MloP_Lo5R7ANS]|uniref:Uncharacterized protein n=1 Tax=Mesorhizobium phage vB_MloP_Lo5R7ANS TaxID=1527771 RepID=A0A076YQK9_9CAUD|nr:hypothetical protein Lo5R7ANS_61 [Mesorhizobium phage vB_MloP_Lo5R7ANS]AIK68531.1 hypothetical protein Lo5R7ANS_61 [Mesorhizobium phage vB_MloP_Lo5R7ANS]